MLSAALLIDYFTDSGQVRHVVLDERLVIKFLDNHFILNESFNIPYTPQIAT